MNHGRVAHKDGIINVPPVDTCGAGRARNKLVQCLNYGRVHFSQAIGVFDRIGDAAHQIFAIGHLGVHERFGGYDLTRAQVA